jgi:hypothetical protein
MERNRENSNLKIWPKRNKKRKRQDKNKSRRTVERKRKWKRLHEHSHVFTDITIVTFVRFDRETQTYGKTTAG